MTEIILDCTVPTTDAGARQLGVAYCCLDGNGCVTVRYTTPLGGQCEFKVGVEKHGAT